MTRKQKRLAIISMGMGFLALSAGLTLFALGQQTSYFYMPADVLTKPVQPGERIRLGGLVASGSIQRVDGTHINFAVTDGEHTVKVGFNGILPDLFREEQGVVTEGTFDGRGMFVADSVLAKHDENYMPREVADGLKDKGLWQHNEDGSSDDS